MSVYGDRWFSSRDKHQEVLGGGVAAQPLSEVELTADDEISQDEFEAALARQHDDDPEDIKTRTSNR